MGEKVENSHLKCGRDGKTDVNNAQGGRYGFRIEE
jgi:hypothetical protein